MSESETPQPEAAGARRRRRRSVAALALLCACLVPVYRMGPEHGGALETKTAGLTAHSLVREGDVGIEEYYPEAAPGGRVSYAVRWRGERLTGIEPLASSLTFAVFLLPWRGLPPDPAGLWPVFPRVAATVAALAAFALGVCLLDLTRPARALGAAAIVALATPHRTIAAAALWQHTSASLWLALGLLAWARARRRPGGFVAAGAALAMATACRPILVPVPLALLADTWWGSRPPLRTRVLSLLCVVVLGGAALGANLALHGSPLGGRVGILTEPGLHSRTASYFEFSLEHLAGLLVAPSRGLFVYSPVLLFGLGGMLRCLRNPPVVSLRWLTLGGLGVFLLYGWVSTWWAGVVFGPRYGTDLVLFFGVWLALAPLPRRLRPAWVAGFVAALAASLAVQEIGARAYPCSWNHTPVHVDRAPGRVWDWRDTQIGRCIRKLRRPPPLPAPAAHAPAQAPGVYQMGDVQARSWIVRGTVGSSHAGGRSPAGSARHCQVL